MNTFRTERATDDTLADAYALHPDTEATRTQLLGLRGRVAEGRFRPEQILLLRSERGVEAAVTVGASPHVPLIPRYRADIPADALTSFLGHLRAEVQVTPGRELLLDDALVVLRPQDALAAGWRLVTTTALFHTDLRGYAAPVDPAVRVLDGLIDEALALAAHLGRPDLTLEPGTHLLGIEEEAGELAGVGAVSPSGRPGWANLDLIGVRPDRRGRGLGTRLHRQMLAFAALSWTDHAGQTDALNRAMRRVLARNGSRNTGTQLYFQM